jgi:hypothetical protein
MTMTAILFFGEVADDGYAPVTGVNLRPDTLTADARAKGVAIPAWPPAEMPPAELSQDAAGSAFVDPETATIVWRESAPAAE